MTAQTPEGQTPEGQTPEGQPTIHVYVTQQPPLAPKERRSYASPAFKVPQEGGETEGCSCGCDSVDGAGAGAGKPPTTFD